VENQFEFSAATKALKVKSPTDQRAMTNRSHLYQIYAIVVTFNAARWIEQCLCSLAESTYPMKVVVVDNNSSDDTLEKIMKLQTVTCLPLQANVGFGRANNVGISYAIKQNADFIFLLNQDGYVDPTTLEILISVAIQHRTYGLFSPLHMNGSGDGVDPFFLKHICEGAPQFLEDVVLGKQKQQLYEMTSPPNAAAWLLTRDCVFETGGFNPMFFMYGEDDELYARIRHRGFKVGLVPDAQIYHHRESAKRMANLWISRQFVLTKQLVTQRSTRNLQILFEFRPLLSQIMKFLADNSKSLLENILYLHPRAAIAVVASFLMTVVAFPKIVHFRTLRCQPGPHWLKVERSIVAKTNLDK